MAQEIIVPQSYGPRTSVGTLNDILARQLGIGPEGTVAQLRALPNSPIGAGLPNMAGVADAPANLAVSSARMRALQAQLGGPLTDTSQLGLSQMSAPEMQALGAGTTRMPGIPVTPSGDVLTGAGMGQAPLALNAGSATTQAGAVNASRAAAANPGLAAELNSDVAALRGAPTGTAAATGEGGLLSQLRGGLGSEGALGGYLGAGPMGALKTLGSRAGAGTLYALAPTALGMGVEAFGKPIEHALGLAPGSTKGSAQAGADVGTGALLGTLVAPGPGTLIGAALGGLKDIVPLAGELIPDIAGSGVAQEWGKATNQFNKIITKPTRAQIGKQGEKYLNNNYLPAGQELMRQAKAGEITHNAAVQGMQKLNTMMQKDMVALKAAHRHDQLGGKKRTATQIQMGEAMAALSQDTRAQGAAAEQTLNNLAMDPNMAAVAPILNASGAMRNQWGNTQADAYTGAAYLDIPEKRLDAKLAEMRQLQQQIAAAKSSGASGGSSLADLAAKVK